MAYTSRTIPDALNTKAFFIARRAVVETPKAKVTEIKKLLSHSQGELLGKLVNKRRGQSGEKGLYGAKMTEAIGLIVAARLRSVAFLKSGWLPAIKRLEKIIDPKWRRGAAREDKKAKQYGQPKGSAIPAIRGSGMKAQVIIENAADPSHSRHDALMKYGAPALRKAFDFEVGSMKNYIERRMRDDARRAGIRTS